MSADGRCEETRALAPELALGVAEGDDRARALEHLAGCAACRRHLGELSDTADELVLLAPSEEPPAGFEGRVLGELRSGRPGRRRGLLRPAAALAATAAVAIAATLVLAHRDDRDLASRYRDTLEEANGRYLAAGDLTGPGGEEVGHAFGYEGEPSWLLVTVSAPGEMGPGVYQLELVAAGGERTRLRPMTIANGEGSAGQAIPGAFHDVAAIRLLGPGRGEVYQARFDR